MHLLSLVADRLWLVKDGDVTPFDEDLEDYRRMLLSDDTREERAEKKARPKRDEVQTLRQEVRKSEERIEKLTEMRKKLDAILADPALYAPERAADARKWQAKSLEVTEGLQRAEALWLQALERLEAAEG